MTAGLARIVITGMGSISPLGRSPAEQFRRVLSGESSARSWPDLESAGYRSATACRVAGLEVEPSFRGRELACLAAEGALASAGLGGARELDVFVGSTLGESYAFERAAEGETVDLADVSVASFARAIRDRLGLRGRVASVSTACAAGNCAVGAAMTALRRDESRVALAGGVEPFSRLAMVGFTRSRAMCSETCRPFDARRDGMLLGEGAALFVLERRDDALRRGASPLAEVVSLGLASDAYHAVAPDPTGSGMLRAMQSALAQAGIGKDAVDWVNAHGSGTRASDAAEGRALRELFGHEQPLVSGSKGALGHALGAASALELALCVEGLRAQTVPPTFGFAIPDPECGASCSAAPVARPLRWVLNNAFAFGGVNSSLLVRSAEA
jgi:3-oxoacyl-[acyl-carrier-protein] synthase II